MTRQDKCLIDWKDANEIYQYLWYMLAHKDNNITFRYVPPEYRNRETLQKACDNIMNELSRVEELK